MGEVEFINQNTTRMEKILYALLTDKTVRNQESLAALIASVSEIGGPWSGE